MRRSCGYRPVIVNEKTYQRATPRRVSAHRRLRDGSSQRPGAQSLAGTLPELQVDIERIVTSGDDALMPMLWVRASQREDIAPTLEADLSVDNVELLGASKTGGCTRCNWGESTSSLTRVLTDSEATILEAAGATRGCSACCIRDVADLQDSRPLSEHNRAFEVSSIRELDEDPAGRYGLTSARTRSSPRRPTAATSRCPARWI